MLQRQGEILDIIEQLVKWIEGLLGKDNKTVLRIFQENQVITHIEEIEKYYKEIQNQKIYINAVPEILSVKASAIRVIELANSDELKMSRTLEFELLPLTENLRLSFYYRNWIENDADKRKKFFEEEVSYYHRNRYLEEAKKTRKYKYELSIIVVAYNKLEYTKLCVESLNKYMPKGVSYELIYINHGSSDGTKKYFESQKPNKLIDVEVNGGIGTVPYRIVEGKYRLLVSNDIVVTQNAIENMYKCIESDRKIGWVVPTTPNISNLQTIEANYKTLDEMHQFARKNNISDFRRWEEKPRLCNPIDIVRTEDWFDLITKNILILTGEGFPDDKISYFFRRNGYKLILAKDAYCYHFGSITNRINNVVDAQKKYCKGRIDFLRKWNIDPWGYGITYDLGLFANMDIKRIKGGKILGINSGMGGNPLRIKALLKEHTDIQNIHITYITQYEMNYEDIKHLGDQAYKVCDWKESCCFLKEKYNCILLENGLEGCNVAQVEELKKFLVPDGILMVRILSEDLFDYMNNIYTTKVIVKQTNNYWVQIL